MENFGNLNDIVRVQSRNTARGGNPDAIGSPPHISQLQLHEKLAAELTSPPR